MQIARKNNTITEAEYLQGELDSETRHEYVDGDVVAMAGASKNHRRLSGNIFSLFREHLKDHPCEPSVGDARVKVASSYLYPDVVVDCDDDDSADTLYAEKPKIIVEVLSRSTRHRDRGVKLLTYINIPTVEEYVLIEQEFASIDVFRKTDGWVPRNYALGQDIHFASIDLTVSVADIYHRVNNEDMTEFLSHLL